MATITTRAGKGSPLTNTEVDDNFSNLNSAKYESGASSPAFADLLSITSSGGQNYVQGDIRLSSSTVDSPGARGQGVFMFNAGHDTTWYAGTGYNQGDDYHIGFVSGASLNTAAAVATNAHVVFYSDPKVIFNVGGLDMDFQIKSNDHDHMLFVDAGVNKVGIGVSDPHTTLEVGGSLQLDAIDAQIYLKGGITGTNSYVNWTFNTNDTIYTKIGIDYDTRATTGFHIDAGYPITIDSSSGTGVTFLASTQGINKFSNSANIFNEKGENIDFRVESMVSQYTIFMDATNGHVGFGDASPSSPVDVNGPISYASRASRSVAGGGANTNYHLIYEKDFQSASSFTTNQHRVVITGAGGTSGQTGSAEFIVNFKQQTSTKSWNIMPIERHGINLCYVWDASGGSQSAGSLKIYAASAGGNYMYMQVDATSRDSNPAGDVTRGAFPCTDTGSATAPTASVVLETPLTVYPNRYNQNGYVDNQYVINEHGADLDFRVESENQTNGFIINGAGNFASFGNTVKNPSSGFADQHGVGIDLLTGETQIAADTTPLSLNRTTTAGANGTYLEFRGGSVVLGAIKISSSDNLQIQASSGGGAGLELWGAGGSIPTISPIQTTNGATNLGRTSERYGRLHLQDGIQDGGSAGSSTVFNDDGTTADFRVESDSQTHALFVDGSSGLVGVNKSNPSFKLHVQGSTIGTSDGDTTTHAAISGYRHHLDFKEIRTANASDWNNTTYRLQMRVDSTNHQSIDFVSDNAYQKHIDIMTSSGAFNSRFTSNGRLGVGTVTPSERLEVAGAVQTTEGYNHFYEVVKTWNRPTGASSYSSTESTAMSQSSTTRVPPGNSGMIPIAAINSRAFQNYICIKTSYTSNNLMFQVRYQGYMYGMGICDANAGGYTYGSPANAVISKHYYRDSNAGGQYIADLYRTSTGHLCIKIYLGHTGYTEGWGNLWFGGHGDGWRDIQVLGVQIRNDGSNHQF